MDAVPDCSKLQPVAGVTWEVWTDPHSAPLLRAFAFPYTDVSLLHLHIVDVSNPSPETVRLLFFRRGNMRSWSLQNFVQLWDGFLKFWNTNNSQANMSFYKQYWNSGMRYAFWCFVYKQYWILIFILLIRNEFYCSSYIYYIFWPVL